MVKVEFSKKEGNPFYGMSNTLSLFQEGSKGNVSERTMDAAWREASTPEQKAMLMTVLFFIGDVTNRQHNIFNGNKVDNGGNAQREAFRDVVIPFLLGKTTKLSSAKKQELLNLIVEYTTMDNLFAARVKTKKGTNRVEGVTNMINMFGVDELAKYAINIVRKGTLFQKVCLAKFLTRPRMSKRTKHKTMLQETREVMSSKFQLINLISQGLKFPVDEINGRIDFTGWNAWRKIYNQDLESVLFSSKKVLDLDKEEFISLISKAPSDARFRIRNRVMFNEKWAKLKPWFEEWENFKEVKQEEQRKIETKIANGTASESDVARLSDVKKAAKVTTGAISFTKLFSEIMNGTVDKIKVQPFLDKISLPYNSLIFIDDSGSMDSKYGSSFPYTAREFGAFIASIILSKNPDPEARDLVGLFSATTRMFGGISKLNTSPNSLLTPRIVKTASKPLINPEAHFLDNMKMFKHFLDSESTGNGTNVSSIPEYVAHWAKGDSAKLEQLRKYPIWTLVSDGNFNNMASSTSSMLDFMRRCETLLGFKPFLILIDVAGSTSAPIKQFSGIDNVMMIPPNPANIEMFLTNFKDMDVYDVYTPLLSLSRSNRYDNVKNFSVKNL